MPQPTSSDVHVDAILTNISVAYMNNATNFIASSVFPMVPVQKQTDKYFTYTKNDWFRDEAQLRADSTESAGSGYNVSTTTYSCDVFAIHKDIGEQTRANADAPMNLDSDATQFVTQRLLLKREIQFVTDAFGLSKWATDVVGTTNFVKWSDYTSSDPITDIETGKKTILAATGYEANTLVLGYNTWRYLKNHPDLVDRIKYGGGPGNPAVVGEGAVASVFGVGRILVAKAVKATNLEAETAAYSFVYSDSALLCHVAPSPSLLAPSAGYTFTWTGATDGNPVGIRRIGMPHLRAERIEGQIAFDSKVVATDLGYYFSVAV